MSSKTVDENYKRLRAELDEKLSKDKRLTAIADKISKGAADFSDTARYTQIVSKHMSDVIKRNIGELKQPMAKEMVCKELLRDHYELINGVFGEVQVSIDEKLGIHLNPIKPAYPAERVDKWAHSLEDPTVEPSVTERRAASGSENIGNSIHDDCIKENAKVREQAGLDCYLTRDAGGGCCPWCAALEGRYEYASAPDDIFRRHDNCTCTVTYECGKMRQDVWSKRTWEASPEELQARKDAAEAAKPTVNTPEQAKEIERQALEKNPVTKLTPEQAKAIEDKALGVEPIDKPKTDSESETVEKQLNEWESQNYSNDSEKGLLIMPDGTVKDFAGTDHHVTGKEDDIALMNGAVFTHNHPTDNTFSQNDIVTGLVKGNLKEMRAVTSTGDIHILRNNDASVVDRRKFAADYSQMRMKAENIANKKILRGETIDKDKYVKTRLENFMQEHANDYNLSYSKSNVNEIAIDNGDKSGIIYEKADRPISAITEQAINSVPVVEIPGYSLEDSLKIQQQHKDLLIYSRENNNNGECAFTFRDGLTNRREFIGADDNVDFGSDGLNGSNLFVMHNHPRNSSYSDRDIMFLFDNENIKALSIVKNNGHIEILVKNPDYSIQKAKTELGRCYKKYVQNNTETEIDKAINAFIKSGKGGLTWIKK